MGAMSYLLQFITSNSVFFIGLVVYLLFTGLLVLIEIKILRKYYKPVPHEKMQSMGPNEIKAKMDIDKLYIQTGMVFLFGMALGAIQRDWMTGKIFIDFLVGTLIILFIAALGDLFNRIGEEYILLGKELDEKKKIDVDTERGANIDKKKV